MQLDLFSEAPAPRAWRGETPETQAQRAGWEARCLREMADGPAVYCYPGFMGSHHERLVSEGLATRETLGRPTAPAWWTHGAKEWAKRAGVEHRYALTAAGRARSVGDVL